MAGRLPPLKALPAFEAAARHLSFTRAAQELNVTQSAVSQQVKALEEHLGLKLFNRLNREIELTKGGRRYFPVVHQSLDNLATATHRLSGIEGLDVGGRPPETTEDRPAAPRLARPSPGTWWIAALTVVVIAVSAPLLLQSRQESDEPVATARGILPDKPSIAVLPFANRSADSSQDYFAEGIAEDVITDLSKLSGMFVSARNSTFAYKQRPIDTNTIARELGVRYVLDGSVRRAGGHVRINTQLIDAPTGRHIWGDRYDGELADVFALQDEITHSIVSALAVRLTSGEAARLVERETPDADAYDAFLQGWAHYALDTPAAFAAAVPYFVKATRLDPNYSRPHAALASIFYRSNLLGWNGDLGLTQYEAVRNAYKHLGLALRNPTPLAHAVASAMALNQRQFDDAIAEAERAIALDANDPSAYLALSNALTMSGRPQDAIAALKTAMRLNPHHPASYLSSLGRAQFFREHYEDAVVTLEQARRQSPNVGLVYLLAAHAHLGHVTEARRVFDEIQERLKASSPGYPVNVGVLMKSTRRVGLPPCVLCGESYPFKQQIDEERLATGLRRIVLAEL